MVRHRKKKRPLPTSEDDMRKAVRSVIERAQTIRETAIETGIPKSTLARYVVKAKQFGVETTRLYPCYATARVFNDVEEAELTDYLLLASKHHHGLTTKAARDLAFQYAGKNNKKMPPTWETNRQAGEDWLLGFMSRHPRLSVRKPEATSLSRATSFNKKNIGDFFDNLANVMEEYKFQSGSIYNCDETGLTTVHNPPNVIGDKKSKQIGQITSGERGTLVTMLGAINAQGNSIPPFLVFPRVYFKDHMITNAPPGTKGVAHQSGWMTAPNFVVWMDHFICHSHCSQDNKVLLLLDNHDSHISVNALDKAKANGIVMLTFPPHCSHKLQPLDRTVYGPLKKYFNSASNGWLLNHPGQPMTIYDIAPTMGEAYPQAFCPRNIVSGFRVSGIYPFNRDIFNEDEFLSGYVTDRPEPASGQEFANEEIDGENTASDTVIPEHLPTPMVDSQQPGTSEQGLGTTEHFSPEQIRPFPKAGPRKQTRGGRKKGKTLILTDTPVKEQIENEFKEREKRRTSNAKRKVCNSEDKDDGKKKRQNVTRTVYSDIEDSSEDEDTSASELTSDLVEDSPDESNTISPYELKINDYVLVKYTTKRFVQHYTGMIVEKPDENGILEVKFLHRQPSKHQPIFCFPEKEDIDDVDIDDIVQKLPEPTVAGGTTRTKSQFVFNIDLSMYYRLQ